MKPEHIQRLQCNTVFLILTTTYKVVMVTLHCEAEETEYLSTLGSTVGNLVFKLQQISIIQCVAPLFLLHLPLGRHSQSVAAIAYLQTVPVCLLTHHVGLNGKFERSYYPKIFKKKISGWCGSVDGVLACERKGLWFDSRSGHMPRLWVRSPDGGRGMRGTQSMFLFAHQSFPLFLPFSPSL